MKKLRLPIADPCHQNWDGMDEQGGGKRFCDSCSKNVHDLSEMTEPQARQLLDAPRPQDGLCIRYASHHDGSVRFRTPSIRAPAPPAFAGWRAGVAAGIAAMAMTGCADAKRAPSGVTDTHCNYEVGPFSYTLARGEGSCPAAEGHGVFVTDPEPEQVMGKMVQVEPDPVPEMGEMMVEPPMPSMGAAPVEPDVPCAGDDPNVKVNTPPPERSVKGEAPAPAPELPRKMGKIAKPVDKILMGDVDPGVDN